MSVKRRKVRPTDSRRVKYQKTLLNIKDFVKKKTEHVPGVYTVLLSGYAFYRRLFAPDLFSVIEIETTTACNLRCPYCPVSTHYRGAHFMDEELFKKIIDDLAAVNYRGRIHPNWYGEPLLDKRLPSLIEYTKANVPLAEVRIFTNGELLTIDRLKTLIEAGADIFTITHHTDAMPDNLRHVLEYVSETPALQEMVTYRKFDTTYTLRNRGGVVEAPLTTGTRNKCRALSQIEINYKGEVVLCCDDYFGSVIFGDTKTESVVDIWNSPKFKTAREKLKQKIRVYPLCKNCNMLG